MSRSGQSGSASAASDRGAPVAVADSAVTNRFLPAQRWLAAAGLLALAALKFAYVLRLDVNSDEPQHLHVVWGWSTGQLPYRDLFDNHAPLFQMLWSPLFALFGERDDIVAIMRVSVLPLYAGSLWLTWRIARRLWSTDVAIASVAMAAVCEPFFIVSTQFRPDDLWALLWLAALSVCIGGRLDARRGAGAGLLAGSALAVSLKTLPLLATAGFAGLLLVVPLAAAMQWSRGFPWRFLFAFAAALALIPAGFVIFFAANGAAPAMRYALFQHNLVSDLGRWDDGDVRFVLTPLTLPIALAIVWISRPHAGDWPAWTRRAFVLLAAAGYLVFLYGYWPLFTRQDLLPAIPFVAMALAALLLQAGRQDPRTAPWRRLAVAAVVIAELAALLAGHPLREARYRDFEQRLKTVLSLTTPQDFVMDAKGESIFRHRPIYWVLESITLARMRDGSIEDDIAARLARTATPLVITERLPRTDLDFVEANYLAIGNGVRVAGLRLGPGRRGQALRFTVAVPLGYAVATRSGKVPAAVDGHACAPACVLGAGVHTLLPASDDEYVVVWAAALERGLPAGALFAAHAPSSLEGERPIRTPAISQPANLQAAY